MLKKIKRNIFLIYYTIRLICKICKAKFILAFILSIINGILPVSSLLVMQVDENKIKNSLCKANVDFLKTERGYELKRGLGNWFDEGGQLSGGQWQKIALARTYYKNADLYLLDEPSSALDVTAETKIFKSFFEVSKNKIAIYITHRVKIAQDANKIIVLDGGKIVGIGTHAELLKNCSVYQDLYNQENLKNKG